MKLKILTAGAVMVLMAACATTAKYEAHLNSWVGQPAQDLVNSWGYPTSQMTAPNGNTVYVYSRSGSIVLPTTTQTNAQVSGYGNTAYGTATSTTYGGQTINLNCATYMEIDSSQRIVSWHYQGNTCQSR